MLGVGRGLRVSCLPLVAVVRVRVEVRDNIRVRVRVIVEVGVRVSVRVKGLPAALQTTRRGG